MEKHPKYLPVTGEIKKEQGHFKNYLRENAFSSNTIRQKSNYVVYFLNWMVKENLAPEELNYRDFLSFIDYCRSENHSNMHINSILVSIEHYYKYINKPGKKNIENPASGLRIKGTVKKVVSGILSPAELENIYFGYKVSNDRELRNKVILGLLVYQGMKSGDIARLETEHVKLREGKIYIPGSRKINSRILELKPHQILDLQEYILRVRPQLINKETSQLILGMEGSGNIKNPVHQIFRKLRKSNPAITGSKQIRVSVITHWLKHYNLRQAQYMAGHRYVHSTEYYRQSNLEDLQKGLKKFHPLK